MSNKDIAAIGIIMDINTDMVNTSTANTNADSHPPNNSMY